MITKLKICDNCQRKKVIYKLKGRLRYCRICWGMLQKGEDPQPIKKTSAKRSTQEDKYIRVRKGFLTSHPMCQAKIPGCTLRATDIHHKKGRRGILLTDSTYFLAVCRSCHDIIEKEVDMAKESGFSLNRLEDD